MGAYSLYGGADPLYTYGRISQTKKYKNFSIIVANTLFVLSAIKKTPGISTRESAEKLEVSERSVQRYIETLRIAGEWIEYDTALKGWELSVGKSVLWDDF
ncbi:HTH domain-containing protein [Ruminococcaceae bacterium AM07-15]|nr:HTH domain-containing protein [Ruminococcaceae bacterium AM07-15]